MKTESYSAEALLSAIHDFSEDQWCAGWYTDLEFILWSALLGDKRWSKAENLPNAMVAHVSYLSSACDGWWVHCDTVGREWSESGGRVFLPLDEWRTLYASRSPTAAE